MPRGATSRILFFAILFLAALLRLWNLNAGDPLNDEVAYAFRAVGLVDSYSAEETPLEILDPDRPGWLSLSFHDHPPLVFWVQHASMALLGERLWAARLPSALLGIFSVWFVFLIGRRIASERAGLITALLLAAAISHVYISRTAQQEAYVIFFLLAGLWLTLKSLERPRYLIALGIAAGLGFLAKYTIIALAPIATALIALAKPEYFRRREFWIASAVALVIASPVIIYNIQLWRTFGHADLQFAYLLGNVPEAWQDAPGKNIGSLADRVAVFLPRLGQTNSWLFITLSAAAIAGFAASLAPAPRKLFQRYEAIAIPLAAIALLLLFIGPSIRFLTLLAPFLALAIGVFLDRMLARLPESAGWRSAGIAALVFFIAFETAYSWNNEIAPLPGAKQAWLTSPLHYETPRLGYTELEAWFEREFGDAYPAITFETTFAFVRDLQERSIGRARQSGAKPRAALVLTYGDFALQPELWTFERRRLYHGWPILTLAEYQAATAEQGPEFFKTAGFADRYVVASANMVLPDDLKALIATPGTERTVIQNPAGQAAFMIFTSLLQLPKTIAAEETASLQNKSR